MWKLKKEWFHELALVQRGASKPDHVTCSRVDRIKCSKHSSQLMGVWQAHPNGFKQTILVSIYHSWIYHRFGLVPSNPIVSHILFLYALGKYTASCSLLDSNATIRCSPVKPSLWGYWHGAREGSMWCQQQERCPKTTSHYINTNLYCTYVRISFRSKPAVNGTIPTQKVFASNDTSRRLHHQTLDTNTHNRFVHLVLSPNCTWPMWRTRFCYWTECLPPNTR